MGSMEVVGYWEDKTSKSLGEVDVAIEYRFRLFKVLNRENKVSEEKQEKCSHEKISCLSSVTRREDVG